MFRIYWWGLGTTNAEILLAGLMKILMHAFCWNIFHFEQLNYECWKVYSTTWHNHVFNPTQNKTSQRVIMKWLARFCRFHACFQRIICPSWIIIIDDRANKPVSISSVRRPSGANGAASIDADDLPGDVGRRRQAEERHQGRHLRRLASPPHRDAWQLLLHHRCR